MKTETCTVLTAAEDALLLHFSGQTLTENHALVNQFTGWANGKAVRPDWLIEVVPSFETVLLVYDMFAVDEHHVKSWLRKAELSRSDAESETAVNLPVCYELDKSNDLERIALHNNCTIEQVKKYHRLSEYHVYAIGFAPGFAYLGQCAEEIATPRLAKPRQFVSQGAVAIADRQTAVYPLDSPGGWNIVGYCPLVLFNPAHSPATPFEVGQRVRFYSVSESEFEQDYGKSWYESNITGA